MATVKNEEADTRSATTPPVTPVPAEPARPANGPETPPHRPAPVAAKDGKDGKDGKENRTPNNVRKIRMERMMSKAELARRAGVSTLTIDRVENGLPCRMDTKRKILEALGLNPTDRVLVFGEDD